MRKITMPHSCHGLCAILCVLSWKGERNTMTCILKTARYVLRSIEKEDAPALLRCYSDEAAVRRMNSDNCQGTFLMKTLQDVQNAIGFWVNDPCLTRCSIVSVEENAAVGTVEFHYKEEVGAHVLRLDLCSAHETAERIAELLPALCEEGFARFPEAKCVVMKAYPQDEARCSALLQCGFEGGKEFLGFPHYFELVQPFRGVAPCGLVCKYCSERIGCSGCRRIRDAQAPCDADKLTSLRIRTFAAYAREHGDEALLHHLERKAAQGVLYHRDGLTGDYDGFDTSEALVDFLEE